MKVCLVSPYDFVHPGGVAEHVRHLAEELRRRDHEVTILAPSSRVGDDHGIPGYVRIGRSVPVRGNGSVARIALSFHLVRRVRSLLDREAFDVVHYHEPLVPGVPITTLRLHRGANVGELGGAVLAAEDGLGEVLAHLLAVDVDRGRELDVGDVVATEVDVHQPRDAVPRVGLPVVLDALHQG